ncbi:unnamed protein product [Triticum turgidum subsp. durum]|uniref:Hexosyltransferase n=1 Tax=Triticum turgidum subsp. durum TaxID=4567 RepID=A0A9R0Q3K6_TRITD|nr:unnamed protein product [Triticum turgidum subsp. durum]
MADLQKEVDMYHDFLFIDADEGTKPPEKMLAYFKAAYDMFHAEFYVKADDTIYLRPDRLAALLAKDRLHHRTYIGCMKKGPVVSDPNMKWYESSYGLLGNEYFMHASGSLYALSSEVVGAIATTNNDRLVVYLFFPACRVKAYDSSRHSEHNIHYQGGKELTDVSCTYYHLT